MSSVMASPERWKQHSLLLKHRDRIRKVIVFEDKEDKDLLRIQNLFGDDVVLSCDAKCFLKSAFTSL
jgi:hypothetical protein